MTAAGSRRRKTYDDPRSKRWYGVADLRAFGHRSRTLQMGYTRAQRYANHRSGRKYDPETREVLP